MDSYTITITPDDDSGNSTTLTVDTSTGQTRITSVHMHAPAGLTGAAMPSVDVGLLLQAVSGSTPTPAAITADPTTVAKTAPHPVPANTDATADESPATTATVTPQPATRDTTEHAPGTAPAKRSSRRKAGTAPSAKGAQAPSSRASGGRSQPAPRKTVPRRRAAEQPAAAAAESGAERVYRRMPDDFAAVYRQAGTAAAVADHYGVPRHTAQGWVRRHKKQDPTAKN
ncbi:hypothetical protein [Paractinoplanes toevensis]|uniref:Helix-turn-helix domain-containing protein n=1 Tax=Paractinoplanes toevensis TaxID=571911 RepID=A0A919WDQ5_9ACTN|nr:hypothetical protein [Actinoplanes toevensis]GIM98329.1 hypothetical protein Ato02nite_101220 [Actinoplanes toevensis]